MKVTIVLLLLTLSSAMAHLCLIEPVQRGGIQGDSKPGANVCFHTQEPCGGEPKGNPVRTYKRGHMAEVGFMKNLNHFNPQNPGNFSLYGYKDGFRLPLLATIMDSSSPPLTVYSLTLWVPEETTPGNYTLEAVYNTHSSSAPPAFYACADVEVI